MERHDDAVLCRQASYLVPELCTAAYQPASDSMKHLHILLMDRLLRNKTHLRPPDCFTDRRRVLRVILLASKIRLHKLRCKQPHLVTERSDYL
jgi:hypothetical protein